MNPTTDLLALPAEVLACLEGATAPVVTAWRLEEGAHTALLESMGRSLGSTDSEGVVANRRLAVARGDEIHYPTTAEEADELLAGNTAILQRLERADSLFQRLVVEFAEQTNRRVSLSAYISERDSHAFSWHVDKWDNLVVQLQGRKAFDLENGVTKELREGDVLFLPEDVVHRTRTLERSIHLSVVFLSSREA